ncbi:DUF3999 family protein [Rhizorhabdus argentea]|uniref:DUF3999 family protein n=1 Tax=Rhizorhabdus argentea TaxID=1387174 RepID=UPI0030EE00B2
MSRWALPIAMLCAITACSDQVAHDPARPDGYAVRLAVTPAPGAPLQRLSVPAEALAALRTPERSDLRLFDGEGSALPLAATRPSGGRAELSRQHFDALPILGAGRSLTASGAVLSIEDAGGRRVVRVSGAAKEEDGAPRLLGVLLDTRTLADPARSLTLEARWPAQQPVEFVVEASEDLRSWVPIGARTLYRKTADAAGAIGTEEIDLGGADLRRRYLRISWSSPSKLLGPVTIDGATLVSARRIGGGLPGIETDEPRRIDAHDVRFDLDHATALAGLRVTPAAGEMLVPIRIFGRNAPDQGWTRLGEGTLRQPTAEPVRLSGIAFTHYRIEADRRTTGFIAPPRLELLFESMQLLALFSGKPPYTLAVGAIDAENRFLAPSELLGDAPPGGIAALPAAMVDARAASRVALASGEESRWSGRKTLLWGLLLLGVAALAVMVWRLWKPAK